MRLPEVIKKNIMGYETMTCDEMSKFGNNNALTVNAPK